MKLKKTQRGFKKGEFKDYFGVPCSIQESSLGTEHAIWFGVTELNPQIMASQAAMFGIETTETTGWVPYPIPKEVVCNDRMHLTRKQVAKLLPLLQRFVDTGEL